MYDVDGYIRQCFGKLDETEKAYKKNYQEHPELRLDLPHDQEEFREHVWEGLREINPKAKTNEYPISRPQNLGELEEKDFFSPDSHISLVRHYRYMPAWYHTHRFFELFYVLRGECENYLSAEATFHMKEGDICLMAPGTSHAVSAFQDDFLGMNLLVRAGTFQEVFFHIFQEQNIIADFFKHAFYHTKEIPYLLFHTGNEEELQDCFMRLWREEHNTSRYRPQMLSHMAGEFVIYLLRYGEALIEMGSREKNGTDNALFLLTYLQEHYDTITLQELADFFHYSRRQVERIIESTTGYTFTENVRRQKIHRVCQLLDSTDLSIEDISGQVGFASPGYMSRFLKQNIGMSPSEYRRRREKA